jgi:hypothetical protein
LACGKVLTILSMAGGYHKPVQYGRESAHKSRAQGDPSSLDSYMNAIQHISKEEYETRKIPGYKGKKRQDSISKYATLLLT